MSHQDYLTVVRQNQLVKALLDFHDGNADDSAVRTELFRFDVEQRYGLLNSAFIDLSLIYPKWNEAIMELLLRHQRLVITLCEVGMIRLPAWLSDRDEIKSTQARIMHVADDLKFE